MQGNSWLPAFEGLEIDRSEQGVPSTDQFVGQGLGDYLMHAVIDAAWSHEPEQLTMTTSSLDHHKALALYQRCGFRACRQEPRQRIDPRRNGAIDFQSL